MSDYSNPTGKYPSNPNLRLTSVPGICLPPDFALESADRGLIGAPDPGNPPPSSSKSFSDRFPLRDQSLYGFAIARLVGSFSGPGFNLIFRPNGAQKEGKGPDLLELNLTHELWTFPTIPGDLGKIPNRVARMGEKDVDLFGIPYTQIVRDVTVTAGDLAGKRIPVDRLGNALNPNQNQKVDKSPWISDIHFESGLLLQVERSPPVSNNPTICRMASIPHGTTINAQGPPAEQQEMAGAALLFPISPKPPASQPFMVSDGSPGNFSFSEFFDIDNQSKTRLPKDLSAFKKSGSITAEMLKMKLTVF